MACSRRQAELARRPLEQRGRRALDRAPAAPLAITRLRNAALHSAHTQFPAICTKSECASARPHWEHAKTVWTGASWLIRYPPWCAKVALSLAQAVPRAKYLYLAPKAMTLLMPLISFKHG